MIVMRATRYEKKVLADWVITKKVGKLGGNSHRPLLYGRLCVKSLKESLIKLTTIKAKQGLNDLPMTDIKTIQIAPISLRATDSPHNV
jgi:hypothetical protein